LHGGLTRANEKNPIHVFQRQTYIPRPDISGLKGQVLSNSPTRICSGKCGTKDLDCVPAQSTAR
jgi:hypothetical protein